MKKESFAPTVMIDGRCYTPEGWMWVLSFALAGIPWAIKKCLDPEYNLRGIIDDYNKRKKHHFLNIEADRLERRLQNIRKELRL